MSPYCLSVLLRSYVHTYRLGPVKMTRIAFALLFGVHIPEWIPAAWVNGTEYVLIGRKEEIEELERLVERIEEPLTTATDRKGGTSR